MGHSVKFCEADFAGRIAQKEMQTAASVTSVTVDFIQSIVYVSAVVIALMAYLFNTFFFTELNYAGLDRYLPLSFCTISFQKYAKPLESEQMHAQR